MVIVHYLSSVLTLCDPMDRSTPGFPNHHQLLEFTETHVHWVNDAVQPSHPLWSPSPPTFNLSQLQGLFKWVSSPHYYVLSGCILPCVKVSQLSCYLKTLMPKPISTQHCPGHMTGCHVTSAWLEMMGHRLSSSRLGAERIWGLEPLKSQDSQELLGSLQGPLRHKRSKGIWIQLCLNSISWLWKLISFFLS